MMQGVTSEIKQTQDCHGKRAFNKKKALFTSKVDFKLRQKLVKCCTWSTALYGAETWTLREADLQYLGSFKICCLNGRRKPIGNNCVRNEIIHGQKEFCNI
jgi:hypothetical protein